jgi:hypothetical protein
MIEKQSTKTNRGGKREGAGRPKGSTNKISPQEFLDDFEKQSGQTLSKFIVGKIIEADNEGNKELVAKYSLGLAKYVIQDIQQVDVTTNGQTLGVQLVFSNKELPDWHNETNKD